MADVGPMNSVYLFSGEFFHAATDLHIPGRGIDGFALPDERGRERLAIISVEGSAPRERRFINWLPVQAN